MSLYDDLGVSSDATPEEIKSAHRRKAREHHPDAGGDADEFQKIQHAAMVLRDPDRKARYDRTGDDGIEADNSAAIPGQMLSSAFMEVMNQGVDFRKTDIIASVKARLQSSLNDLERSKLEHKQAKAESEAALERLKHNGSGPNYIGSLLSNRISEIDQNVDRLEERIGQTKQAIELAADLSWKVDPPPPTQATFVHMSSTSGTTANWR